jgi:hypothetical protein
MDDTRRALTSLGNRVTVPHSLILRAGRATAIRGMLS